MNEKINVILTEVAQTTFEKMAFIFSMMEPDEDEELSEDISQVHVDFSGPFSGTLLMQLDSDILPELSSNMLGIDDDTPVDQQHDALKEMINVICGNLLPAIGGAKAIFNINAPELDTNGDSKSERNGKKLISEVTIALEDGNCMLSLFLDDQFTYDGKAELKMP